jgi:hypothetical protein
MSYELWETTTSNVVGDFETEDEALEAVLEAVELNGLDFADQLSLLLAEPDYVKGIAAGHDLAQRALDFRERHHGRFAPE